MIVLNWTQTQKHRTIKKMQPRNKLPPGQKLDLEGFYCTLYHIMQLCKLSWSTVLIFIGALSGCLYTGGGIA